MVPAKVKVYNFAMSFETIAQETVSREDESGALTLQDETHNVLMMQSSRVEVAFDAAADPTDPAYGGNYRICITSTLRDDPHPAVVEQHGENWPMLGYTGNRLRHELLRYPVSHLRSGMYIDPLAGLRRAWGIARHQQQEGNVRTDTFLLTVGADHVAAAASKLPKGCWTFGLIDIVAETFYSQEDLDAQTAIEGKLIVQPQPRPDDGLNIFKRVIFPLHDNVMHLQSVAILGTPPVKDLLREQVALLANGEHLEIDRFFDAGPETMLELAGTYGIDWERGKYSVPYYGLRDIVADILAPATKLRLDDAKTAAQRIREDSQVTDEQLQQALEVIDGPGNILDALDDVVASLPDRYVRLSRLATSR